MNHHQEQCSKIPDAFDQNLHGIHLTPCYKKFTLILSSVKKKPDLKRRSSSRITGNQQGSSVLFPEECYFCGKYRITKNRREHLPIRMLTESAEMTVKESAKVKDIELY